ncbi:GntR family transcriptional regulator [Galbibacter sp. BG1]|uniref:winged helix-turn-helix domain-containing protein n=1 Tax=Galbibacter sp. BG1 TaxID=1170699 RepID=UPI0015BFF085|nr:GntR family transcriptional regulator [Galbibacter sp. BG1]QLE02067.1 GntR family transcriptional regulator [Galbibacter sp. BG1]
MESSELFIANDHRLPKYEQFVKMFLAKIEYGEFEIDEKLPSIIECSYEYEVSRATVLRAYKELQKMGAITSVYRKGYFVSKGYKSGYKKKVLMLVSEINTPNQSFYEKLSFCLEGYEIELGRRVFKNDLNRLKQLIEESSGLDHTYIVEPQMISVTDIVKCFGDKRVGKEVIFLLDEDLENNNVDKKNLFNIPMDFENHLQKLIPQLSKYHSLNLVLPENEYFPHQLINSFFNCCDAYNLECGLIDDDTIPKKGHAYLVWDENSLFSILSEFGNHNNRLGHGIGIITLFERNYFPFMPVEITAINWFNDNLLATLKKLILNKNGIEDSNIESKLILRGRV